MTHNDNRNGKGLDLVNEIATVPWSFISNQEHSLISVLPYEVLKPLA